MKRQKRRIAVTLLVDVEAEQGLDELCEEAADHLSVEVGGYGVKNGSFSYKSLKTGRRWKEVLP